MEFFNVYDEEYLQILLTRERKNKTINYLDHLHPNITILERSSAIAWIFADADSFENKFLIISTAVGIFDRFVSFNTKRISGTSLHLHTLTCLIISLKYHYCDNRPIDVFPDGTTFSKKEFIECEWEILATIQHDFKSPVLYDFIEFVCSGQSVLIEDITVFLCGLMLIYMPPAFYLPSQLTLACFCKAKFILGQLIDFEKIVKDFNVSIQVIAKICNGVDFYLKRFYTTCSQFQNLSPRLEDLTKSYEIYYTLYSSRYEWKVVSTWIANSMK